VAAPWPDQSVRPAAVATTSEPVPASVPELLQRLWQAEEPLLEQPELPPSAELPVRAFPSKPALSPAAAMTPLALAQQALQRWRPRHRPAGPAAHKS